MRRAIEYGWCKVQDKKLTQEKGDGWKAGKGFVTWKGITWMEEGRVVRENDHAALESLLFITCIEGEPNNRRNEPSLEMI